ncbi:ATP-binding protein [Janibacter sp. GS2]|uniref:ATP-binding protein n=1 Tax=Janibacter sp. GS2 TaxID=3442646 RepID=UPI003EB8C299
MTTQPGPLGQSLRHHRVTAREAEVLLLVARRRTNAEIAQAMTLSIRTVESHISSLLSKFDVNDRIALSDRMTELAAGGPQSIEPPSALLHWNGTAPFVGRREELRLLKATWHEVLDGEQRVVSISGEAGIGKTSIAAQLARAVMPDAAAVLYGTCHEERTGPVEALGDALSAYVRSCPPEELRTAIGDLLPDLTRIMPGVSDRLPAPQTPRHAGPNVLRHRLVEGLGRLLRSASDRGPVLLVLDDVHAAPPLTVFLLKHLLRGPRLGRVMVVLTYRDGEVDKDQSSLLADLAREPYYTPMRLHPFGRFEVAELIHRSDAGTSLASAEALAASVCAETRGNPFFTVQLLRSVQDNAGPLRSGTTRPIPLAVNDVVDGRLQGLGPTTQHVLRIAAVLGHEFELPLLGLVAEIPETELLGCVEEATNAGLIYDVTPLRAGISDERFSFIHAIVRRKIVSDISRPRRRRLHATIARTLERAVVPDGHDRSDEIARHLLGSGHFPNRSMALHHLTMAGRSALNGAAPEEALEYFERALRFRDVATQNQQAELHFQLGLAQRSVGQWADAVASWRTSIDIAAHLDDARSMIRACLAASYNIAFGLRLEEAVSLANQGLAQLSRAPSPERAALLGNVSFATAWFGDHRSSSVALLEEMKIAEHLGDDLSRARWLASATVHHTAFLQHGAAVAAGTEAAPVLREAGELWELTSMLGFLAFAHLGLGQVAETRAVCDELDVLAERVGNYGAWQQGKRMEAQVEFYRHGDVEALELFARTDLNFCRSVGTGMADHSLGWLGLATFLGGDWARAEAHLREAFRTEPHSGMTGWAWSSLFEFLAYDGQNGEALRMLRDHAHRLPLPGEVNTYGSWTMLMSAVEGLTVMGELKHAHRLYPMVLRCIRDTGVVCIEFRDGRLLERSAGIAAAAGGAWEAAEAHFAKALSQSLELPHVVEHAHILRVHGMLLLMTGRSSERDRATTMLERAQSAYADMGMGRHARICEELITAHR